MPTESNLRIKKSVIAFLSENPGRTAREIGKALKGTIPPKTHSAALYSMKTTGLVLETYEMDDTLPRYSINPEANPDELANPLRVFNRKRGEQTNHRIGCVQKGILASLDSYEFRPTEFVFTAIPNVPPSYIRKMLNRLEEINKVEHIGTSMRDAQWRLSKSE